MKRRAILAAMAATSVRERFLGVWKLVSYARRGTNGQVDYPYSERPVGRITYHASGRMSAQLMRPGRKSAMPVGVSFANGAAANVMANDAELREAAGGFIAYFGTFDVDESTTAVIHHVEACLVASWVGHDLLRKYRFLGNRLMLSAVTGNLAVDLVWERERP